MQAWAHLLAMTAGAVGPPTLLPLVQMQALAVTARTVGPHVGQVLVLAVALLVEVKWTLRMLRKLQVQARVRVRQHAPMAPRSRRGSSTAAGHCLLLLLLVLLQRRWVLAVPAALAASPAAAAAVVEVSRWPQLLAAARARRRER